MSTGTITIIEGPNLMCELRKLILSVDSWRNQSILLRAVPISLWAKLSTVNMNSRRLQVWDAIAVAEDKLSTFDL